MADDPVRSQNEMGRERPHPLTHRASRLLGLGWQRNIKFVLFEWDPAKARRNRRNHRVSFQEAATVFGDPLALTFSDPDHSVSEERFITVGMSSAKRILIVAHADRGET